MDRFREYPIGEKEKKELIELEVLYRVNASSKGKYKELLVGLNDLYEDHLQQAFNDDYLNVTDGIYSLTDKGQKRLQHYAELYQKFKDYAIFKCVYLAEQGPDEGEPDRRFGDFEEEADPDNGSEDLRIAIFENYGKREGKKAPLHILVMFSQMDNRDLEEINRNNDWLYHIASGNFFDDLREIIETQVSMEAILPDEDMDPDELCDEIVAAGFKELKRCFDAQKDDDDHYSPAMVQDDINDFWVEEVVTEHRVVDPYYYDPYYNPYADIALTALVVGAFVYF